MSRIHEHVTYATSRDPWIEGYLGQLEIWRRRSGEREPIVLCQIRRASVTYNQFRVTGDQTLRWATWRAVQTAAASLRTRKELQT